MLIASLGRIVTNARDDSEESQESGMRSGNHLLRSVKEFDLGGRLGSCHGSLAVIDEPGGGRRAVRL
jgi:hypothetical protein